MAFVSGNAAKRGGARGFTLVEVMIVVAIIGILSTIGVPAYRSYVRRAMASEGEALLGAVANMQRIYFAKYGEYFAGTGNGSFIAPDFQMEFDTNKYFTSVTITPRGNDAYDAVTKGVDPGDAAGITLTLSQQKGLTPTIAKKLD